MCVSVWVSVCVCVCVCVASWDCTSSWWIVIDDSSWKGNRYLCLAGRFTFITARFFDLLGPQGSAGFVEDMSDAFFSDGALLSFCGHRRTRFFSCNKSNENNVNISPRATTLSRNEKNNNCNNKRLEPSPNIDGALLHIGEHFSHSSAAINSINWNVFILGDCWTTID